MPRAIRPHGCTSGSHAVAHMHACSLLRTQNAALTGISVARIANRKTPLRRHYTVASHERRTLQE